MARPTRSPCPRRGCTPSPARSRPGPTAVRSPSPSTARRSAPSPCRTTSATAGGRSRNRSSLPAGSHRLVIRFVGDKQILDRVTVAAVATPTTTIPTTAADHRCAHVEGERGPGHARGRGLRDGRRGRRVSRHHRRQPGRRVPERRRRHRVAPRRRVCGRVRPRRRMAPVLDPGRGGRPGPVPPSGSLPGARPPTRSRSWSTATRRPRSRSRRPARTTPGPRRRPPSPCRPAPPRSHSGSSATARTSTVSSSRPSP